MQDYPAQLCSLGQPSPSETMLLHILRSSVEYQAVYLGLVAHAKEASQEETSTSSARNVFFRHQLRHAALKQQISERAFLILRNSVT